MTTISIRFKFRRGTASEWTTTNPVLLEGEPGIELDTGFMKFGDGAAAWNSLPYFAEDNPSTGWAVYNHGGGAQSLATSTRTQLSIDGATKIESQLPLDTGPLWDTATDTITGRTGDGIVCKIQCIFTPSDATASEVLFDVDIGGGVGIVEYQTFAATKGSGMAHYVSWTFAAYTMSTWLANGGKIHATADGPGDITALRIVVQRTHKAR